MEIQIIFSMVSSVNYLIQETLVALVLQKKPMVALVSHKHNFWWR
jgi:hypothetical protein